MKKIIPILAVVIILMLSFSFYYFNTNQNKPSETYEGNAEEKKGLIVLKSPKPNSTVTNPLKIEGMARGYWFFEGSFPITITNWNGLIIGEGFATAEGDLMTEEFVPFKATINYNLDPETYAKIGTLILKKDNPSDLPENDDALEIPIVFK